MKKCILVINCLLGMVPYPNQDFLEFLEKVISHSKIIEVEVVEGEGMVWVGVVDMPKCVLHNIYTSY